MTYTMSHGEHPTIIVRINLDDLWKQYQQYILYLITCNLLRVTGKKLDLLDFSQ